MIFILGEKHQQRGRNKLQQNQRFGQIQMYGGQQHAGMIDPRLSHYGNSSTSHYGRDDRDKRSRRYGSDDRRSSRYGRSDDRDRRHSRRRSRSRSYSSSRSRSRSSSSEYGRRRSRSRSRDRSRRHRDSRRSSSHRDSKKHSSATYGMGTAPGMFPPPPPPPPRRPGMHMQMGQQIPGLLPGQQQMMPGGMQQPLPTHQQMGMGQQGQYYQQPQFAQQQQQVHPNSNVSQQVQHVNNAALGQALMPQGMMGMQARGNQMNRPQMSQNNGQVSIDILALADKASQALSSVQPPGQVANPNFPPPPMQSFQQNSSFASEQDLSTLVQYALQNLRTTGHVDQQPLDGKICSMVKRLPENVALQALETFSSCDVTKMRSKGGYLAGILKKELVKLGL